MIFQRIVLQNVGVYKGLHEVELAPKSKRRPIVLFGALNGSGKTTLIDALQLVLYGKAANLANRVGGAYFDYLRALISKDVNAKRDGAAIELTFNLMTAGHEEAWEIKRLWRETASGAVKELFEVWRDGVHDKFASEHWEEVVEGILPRGVAPLFFFDGEKIEEIASPERAADTIRTGLHALLGIDIVDQLRRDLAQLEKRRRKDVAATPEFGLVDEVERELSRLETDGESACQDVATATTLVSRLRSERDELEAQFRRLGGQRADEVAELKQKSRNLEKDIEVTRGDLRREASGSLPLVLTGELIQQLRGEAARATNAQALQTLADELATLKVDLVERLNRLKAPKAVRAAVEECLQDRVARGRSDARLTPELEHFLAQVSPPPGEWLRATLDETKKLVCQVGHSKETLAFAQQKLAAVAGEEQVSEIAARVAEKERELAHAEGQLVQLDLIYKKIKDERKRTQEKLKAAKTALVDAEFANEKDRRVFKQLTSAEGILAEFRRRSAAKHLMALEGMILESFQALIRKPKMVKAIRLEPETYRLRLIGDHGAVIDPVVLSAGERQLLAVAILWGLAKACGRPLPAVIDTPLGRLDSTHRGNLVNNYFPNASHQVVLLSTDKEIDAEYYEALKGSVSREYQIVFDDEQGGSKIVEGYFG